MTPRVRTQTTPATFCDALRAAWSLRFGELPSDRATALLWAQHALETGRGSSCYCWNVGNRKARYGEPYCELYTWEIIGGKRVDLVDKFAAFDSLQAGVADWLELFSRQHYSGALEAVRCGDAASYANALRLAGYYTASETDYARGLASLQREALSATERPSDRPTTLLPEAPPEWQPQTSAATAFPGIVPVVDSEAP